MLTIGSTPAAGWRLQSWESYFSGIRTPTAANLNFAIRNLREVVLRASDAPDVLLAMMDRPTLRALGFQGRLQYGPECVDQPETSAVSLAPRTMRLPSQWSTSSERLKS
jgi:hypothetical protein